MITALEHLPRGTTPLRAAQPLHGEALAVPRQAAIGGWIITRFR